MDQVALLAPASRNSSPSTSPDIAGGNPVTPATVLTPPASAIGHQVKALPDLISARAIERHVANLSPVEMYREVFEFDLSGQRVHESRPRVVADLQRDGWRVETSERWLFGWEVVLVSPDSEVLLVSASPENVFGCAFTRDSDRSVELVRRVERVAGRLSGKRSRKGEVAVRFWYLGSDGPSSYVRRVRCEAWEEIEPNYPAGAKDLARLMGMRRPYERGHFVFWHGPAGTGKTTAVRALIRSWRDMDPEVITDPDVFLENPEYMNELLVEPTSKRAGGGRRTRRGRLLILEDAPELMQAEQGSSSRATLAKLLNATDGILRDELHLVVLATTHERTRVPGSALTRPGRCLQVLEFPRFDRKQAAKWIEGRKQPPANDMRDASLAELYQREVLDAPAPHRQEPMGFAGRASRV